jgi:hypothetical protein
MVQQSDRIALGEAKRIFTNSRNVQTACGAPSG